MRPFLSALVALVATTLGPGVAAQDTEWNRSTLEELGGVHVSVEAGAFCEGGGVTLGAALENAEGQLLEADVGLLTEEEMLLNLGLPELRIEVACITGSENMVGSPVAYSVSVRLLQSAQMTRDNQITLAEAVTWYTTVMGIQLREQLQDAVREAIAETVGQFAAAYTAAHEAGGGGFQSEP